MLHLCMLLFILFVLLPGTAIIAREYSVFGEIDMEGSFAYTPEGESGNLLESALGIEANHRLEYDTFSFTARHRAEVDRQEQIDHNLYEAYLNYRVDESWTISAGKQRIPWGRGVAFFPTDVLHPSHTREDVEGFTGLSLILNPSLNLQLAGALDFSTPLTRESSAENEGFYKDLKYALYMSLLAGTTDWALSGVYSPDGTLRPGLGASSDIFGFIITAEGAVELNNPVEYPNTTLDGFETHASFRPCTLVSTGISRTFTPRHIPDLSLMMVTEYIYAGTGYDEKTRNKYFTMIEGYLASGGEPPEIEYLGRNYLFAFAGLELYQRFSLEFSAYLSIDDQSGLYTATASLLRIPEMDLSIEGELTTGSTGSVFGFRKSEEGESRITLKSTVYF